MMSYIFDRNSHIWRLDRFFCKATGSFLGLPPRRTQYSSLQTLRCILSPLRAAADRSRFEKCECSSPAPAYSTVDMSTCECFSPILGYSRGIKGTCDLFHLRMVWLFSLWAMLPPCSCYSCAAWFACNTAQACRAIVLGSVLFL